MSKPFLLTLLARKSEGITQSAQTTISLYQHLQKD